MQKQLILENVLQKTLRKLNFEDRGIASISFCSTKVAIGKVNGKLILFDLKQNARLWTIQLDHFLFSDMCLFNGYLLAGGSGCLSAVDLTSAKRISFPRFDRDLVGFVTKICVVRDDQKHALFCVTDKSLKLYHLDFSDFFEKPRILKESDDINSSNYKNLLESRKRLQILNEFITIRHNLSEYVAESKDFSKTAIGKSDTGARAIADRESQRNQASSKQANLEPKAKFDKLSQSFQDKGNGHFETAVTHTSNNQSDDSSDAKKKFSKFLSEMSKYKSENEKLQEEVKRYKSQFQEQKARIQSLDSQLSEFEKSFSKVNLNFKQKMAIMDELNKHCEKLQKQNSELISRVEVGQVLTKAMQTRISELEDYTKRLKSKLAERRESESRSQKRRQELTKRLEQSRQSLAKQQAKTTGLQRQMEAQQSLNQQMKLQFTTILQQSKQQHTENLKQAIQKLTERNQAELVKLSTMYQQKLEHQDSLLRSRLGAECNEPGTKTTASTQTCDKLEQVVQAKLAQITQVRSDYQRKTQALHDMQAKCQQELLAQKQQMKAYKANLARQFENFRRAETKRILEQQLSQIRQKQKEYYLDIDNPDPKASIFRDLANLIKLFSRIKHNRWI